MSWSPQAIRNAINVSLIALVLLFEFFVIAASYERGVANSARIMTLEAGGVRHSNLESVEWRCAPRQKEEIKNTYRPFDESGDTLEFAQKVITNIDLWREATAR